MRKWLGFAAASAAALMALFAFGRAFKEREEEPRIRRVGPDVVRAAVTVDAADVLLASLWRDGRIYECRAPAIYGPDLLRAKFGSLLRLSLRSAHRAPAVVGRGAAWVAREQLDLAASNDAEVASKLVSLPPGGPSVVRVLRSGVTPAPILGDFVSRAA